MTRIQKLFTFSILLLSSITSYGQEFGFIPEQANLLLKGDRANNEFARADSLLNEYMYDSAEVYFERALVRYEEYYGQGNIDIVPVYQAISELLAQKEYPHKSIYYAERGLGILEAQYKPDALKIAQMYMFIGDIYRYNKQGIDAINKYARALRTFQNVKGTAHYPDMIKLYMMMGNTYYFIQDFGKAISYYRKAVNAIIDLDTETRTDVTILYQNIANALLQGGSVDLAKENISKSIEIGKVVYGNKSPEVADSYQLLASIHFEQMEYDSAMYYSRKAMDIRDWMSEEIDKREKHYAKLGKDFFLLEKYELSREWYDRGFSKLIQEDEPSKELGEKVLNVAEKFRGARKWDDAIHFYETAHSVFVELDTAKERNVKQRLKLNSRVIDLSIALQDYTEAKKWIDRSVTLRKEKYGEDSEEMLVSLFDLGNIYGLMGEKEEALKYYEEIMGKVKGSESRNEALVYNNLAMLYFRDQDYKSSLNYATKLTRYYEDVYATDYIKTEACYMLLGNIYHAMGKSSKAWNCYWRVLSRDGKLYDKPNEVALQANQNLSEIFTAKGDAKNAQTFKVKTQEVKNRMVVQ
ncbi:tetratricopeptide repeat protein [Sediminitomix flava]|uniref:Tetratricopeptide repeat protein n=1 Tax=Sediminitomix flava TaxID=379075 RepID=A0A315Z116_SEDFL|nr:tetratricopeptide repeat protein [Sediminitomix flava]PWJ36114.1 tetratricopeptide repeat protein [Sediminitomix flava]